MSGPILHYELSGPDLNIGITGPDLTSSNVSIVSDSERGPVANFDGSTSDMRLLSISSPSSLTGNNQRTYMYWVKPLEDKNYQLQGQSGSQSTNWLMQVASNRLYVSEGADFAIGSSSYPVVYNEWNHIAGTYDGATIRAFVNGVQAGTLNRSINTNVGDLTIGFDEGGLSTHRFVGLMSDFRAYDYALSSSQIASEFQTSSEVIFFTLTPWSTLVELSWSTSDTWTFHRITIDSGSGESIVVDNTNSLSHVVYNLEPETTFTIRWYTSNDRLSYTLVETESISTLADTPENANMGIFLKDGVYSFSILDSSTYSRLEDYLTTGVTIEISGFTAKLVTRGGTSEIPSGNVLLFPFNPSDGPSQSATIELPDTSTVSVEYDENNDTISVGGTMYSSGDSFVLGGKKVSVHEV